MRTAKQLLERLTDKYPPPEGAKHALALHEGGLLIILATWAPPGEGIHHFVHITIGEEDLDRPAQALFRDVVALMNARKKD